MSITMNDLSYLAHSLVKADSAVEEAEQQLKQAKEAARVVREETLPAAMQELQLSKIKLDTGEEITVNQEVYLSLSVSNKPIAFAWLRDNGFGGLIKNEVKACFGREEGELAAEAVEALQALGVDVETKQDVHAQTLKAWAKEQLAEGKEFPMDTFGARPVWTAKVKLKKN